jgi:hypothetical protein
VFFFYYIYITRSFIPAFALGFFFLSFSFSFFSSTFLLHFLQRSFFFDGFNVHVHVCFTRRAWDRDREGYRPAYKYNNKAARSATLRYIFLAGFSLSCHGAAFLGLVLDDGRKEGRSCARGIIWLYIAAVGVGGCVEK